MARFFVLGLDGVPPELLFEKWSSELPNIRGLMERGAYAGLDSTIPPASIIAWSSFASGRDASELGIYSYTRRNPETGRTELVNSTDVRADLIWDILSKKGMRSIVLFVPLTFPAKKINGIMVTDFLTPGIDSNCCYPAELKEYIKTLGNMELFFDVAGFTEYKGLEPGLLLQNAYKMTEMHVSLIKHLLQTEKYDFFMAVLLGTDRVQHMLWKYFDKQHRHYEDSKLSGELLDFYRFIDRKVGEILALLDSDTTVIMASDHGMKGTEGKINLNDWLVDNGYLVLKDSFRREVEENRKKGRQTKLVFEGIDFSMTRAYSIGAYHARIFINSRARSPEGILDERQRLELIGELKSRLSRLRSDTGRALDTKFFLAKDIYKSASSRECPDMIVYFDNLVWSSNPDLGNSSLYSWKTAVGADCAGHAPKGFFIISGRGIKPAGRIGDVDIHSITPTILSMMGINVPGLEGKRIKIVEAD